MKNWVSMLVFNKIYAKKSLYTNMRINFIIYTLIKGESYKEKIREILFFMILFLNITIFYKCVDVI